MIVHRIATAAALGLGLTTSAIAAPLFTERTEQLGQPQPCAGPSEGCYSNYAALADLDADGDLDAVFASGGGYYEPATTAPLAVYVNDGAAGLMLSDAVGGFAGRLRQVAIGDVDGDGDLDLIAPDSWAMQSDAVFINTGETPLRFVDEGATRLGTRSRAGAVRLGDLDADGDLDLIITDWGAAPPTSPSRVRAFTNDGAGGFTELVDAVPSTTTGGTGTGPIDVDLVDVDNDFDLDLLVASRVGESLLYRNDGTGHFVAAGADLPDQTGPYVYGPDACDVDGDGDLDLWLDNGRAPLVEQLVINDGTGHFTDETATRVSGNPSADDNEVQCVDIDDDGDFDALVASLDDHERILVNDGAGHFTALTDAFPPVTDATLGLDLGDLDGDGRLDAITAQGENLPFLNRLYLATTAQAVDTQAPRVRAIDTTAEPVASGVMIRFALSDRATSDVAVHLRNVHLEIAGVGDVPVHPMGGDLYRAVVTGTLPPSLEVTVIATDAHGNTSNTPATVTVPSDMVDAPIPIAADAGVDAAPDGTAMPDGGCCGTGSRLPALTISAIALLLRRRRR